MTVLNNAEGFPQMFLQIVLLPSLDHKEAKDTLANSLKTGGH